MLFCICHTVPLNILVLASFELLLMLFGSFRGCVVFDGGGGHSEAPFFLQGSDVEALRLGGTAALDQCFSHTIEETQM